MHMYIYRSHLTSLRQISKGIGLLNCWVTIVLAVAWPLCRLWVFACGWVCFRVVEGYRWVFTRRGVLMHAHTHTHVYTYVCVHIYLYVCKYVDSCIRTHVCINIYVYIYIYTYMYICICIYIYIYMYVYVFTYT